MQDDGEKRSANKVILMCGPAGSGKSTYARKLEKEGMTVLSYDEESFKRGITRHPLPEKVAEEIKHALDEKLISLLKQGMNVVLDYSFWSADMRNEYIGLVKEYGIEPLIYYFKVSKEIAMDRIRRRRGNHKNEIRLTEEMASFYFDHFQPPSSDEGVVVVFSGERSE